MMRWLIAILAGSFVLAGTQAQYPIKPVRLIVAFPQVRDAFGIRHSTIAHIEHMIAVVLIVTSAFEIAKFFLRRKFQKHTSQ